METKNQDMSVDERESNIEEDDDEDEHVILDMSRRQSGGVISLQPHIKHAEQIRKPLPISVGRGVRQVVPISGLHLLHDLSKVRIQQLYDLHYLTAGLTSENRYVVFGGERHQNEALFGCCETSSSWQRLLCGTRRRLHLTLVDQTQQEAATFHRRLASSISQTGIYLQRMDAFLPGGEFLGSVEQEWSPGYPKFSVRDPNRTVLFRIRANACCPCSQPDFVFYILDGSWEVVSHISHEWDRDLVDYDLCVVLPPSQSVRSKALILAAAFLLEYMYFLPSKEGSCFKSCCK